MRWVALFALVGCGDNLPPVCEIEPPMLPAGPLSDPYALELADCVEGGLARIGGRWFVRDAALPFEFLYPRYQTTCDGGARMADVDDYDHDLDGGGTESYRQWWDGTRAFTRQYFRFEVDSFVFENARASVVCLASDGTLVGRWASFDSDFGETGGPLVGTRFDRKDELAAGLELVGEAGRSTAGGPIVAYNLIVDDGTAYVAGPSGLELVDVVDPAAPTPRAHLDASWNDVRVVHGPTAVVAFGATNTNDTTLVDVTDPTSVHVAGSLRGSTTSFATSHSLQLAGNLLYLADYTDAVPVFDVTDPLVPVFVGAAQVPDDTGSIHDLTVDGGLLFVNQTSSGFVALDVSKGLGAPTVLGRVPGTYSHASAVGIAGGRKLALHGDEGMTGPDGGAFLRVLDGEPSHGTFLTELGRYQSRPEVGIHNFELVGDRAYIAYYQDGVRVVDLSDPAHPREVAHYNTWDPETASSGSFTGALGIRVVDGLIYVADSERGLMVLRETE